MSGTPAAAPLSPSRFTLFFEGDDLYDAMVGSIASAQQDVGLEAYIFADDEVGWALAEALAERARSGVPVKVHVDAVGSWSLSPRLAAYLGQHGVNLRWFHRWSWRHPGRFNRRNHRKLLVVDRRQAYVGGFNIHRESSQRHFGAQRWRDTHVRLEGRLAAEGYVLFDGFWRGDRGAGGEAGSNGGDALIPNDSPDCRHRVHCLYVELLRRARRSIFLTTPYFVPDHQTQRELVRAAQRSVDVRLLLPGKSDVAVTRWAARASYQRLLQSGVRVFEYQPRVLHAKTVVVDGSRATVGTANLDYRSLFVNYELNLFSSDARLCGELQQRFLEDLAATDEIRLETWGRRAWPNMARETVGWLARRWL